MPPEQRAASTASWRADRTSRRRLRPRRRAGRGARRPAARAIARARPASRRRRQRARRRARPRARAIGRGPTSSRPRSPRSPTTSRARARRLTVQAGSTACPFAVSTTSMLPRVAFEYGQTWCAALHELHGRDLVVDRRQRDGEGHRELVAAALGRRQHHARVDRDVGGLEPAAPGHRPERALEAGGVADREELLGVRAAALSAHLRRRAQIDLQGAVRGAAMAGDAAAGDVCVCGVDDASVVSHAREVPPRRGACRRSPGGCFAHRGSRTIARCTPAVVAERVACGPTKSCAPRGQHERGTRLSSRTQRSEHDSQQTFRPARRIGGGAARRAGGGRLWQQRRQLHGDGEAPPVGSSGDGERGEHRTRQGPRRLAGPDPLPVREGLRHQERVLRRMRHGMAAAAVERQADGRHRG